MSLLLANPIPRRQVVLETTLAMGIYAVVIGLAVFAGTALGSIIAGLGVSIANLAAASLLGTLLGLAFGALALALGGLTGRARIATYGTIGAAASMQLLNGFLTANDDLAGWAKLTPFHYYLGGDPLNAGLDIVHAGVLAGLAAVLVLVAVATFDRRDLRRGRPRRRGSMADHRRRLRLEPSPPSPPSPPSRPSAGAVTDWVPRGRGSTTPGHRHDIARRHRTRQISGCGYVESVARIEEDGDDVVIRLSGWEKAGALRGHVRFPRAQIRSVTHVRDARAAVRGVRAPGTGVPGRVALGTWRRWHGKDFVAAYRHDPGVVIDLVDQPYDRVVISGPAPDWLLGRDS